MSNSRFGVGARLGKAPPAVSVDHSLWASSDAYSLRSLSKGKHHFSSTGAGNGPPPSSTLDLLYSPPIPVFPSPLHHTPRPSIFSAQRLSLVERGACRCSVATRVLCPVSHFHRLHFTPMDPGHPRQRRMPRDDSESKKLRWCTRNNPGPVWKLDLLHTRSLPIGRVDVETAHAAPGSSLNVSRNSSSPTNLEGLLTSSASRTLRTLHWDTTLLTALKLMSVARPTATFAPS